VGDDETRRRLAPLAARQKRGDVRLDVFPDAARVPDGRGNVPEADDAVARIGAHLREHLG
jgi:hypothetical protein